MHVLHATLPVGHLSLEFLIFMSGPRGAGAETAKVARASCARTGVPCWYLKAEGAIHSSKGPYVFMIFMCFIHRWHVAVRPSIVTFSYLMAGAPQIMQSGGRRASVFEETCFFLN